MFLYRHDKLSILDNTSVSYSTAALGKYTVYSQNLSSKITKTLYNVHMDYKVRSHFRSTEMTACTLRVRRSVYVWPVPTNTIGCPVMYVMEIAAPTCGTEGTGGVKVRSLGLSLSVQLLFKGDNSGWTEEDNDICSKEVSHAPAPYLPTRRDIFPWAFCLFSLFMIYFPWL